MQILRKVAIKILGGGAMTFLRKPAMTFLRETSTTTMREAGSTILGRAAMSIQGKAASQVTELHIFIESRWSRRRTEKPINESPLSNDIQIALFLCTI